MRIIKLSIDIIVEPLTEIINLSLVSDAFLITSKSKVVDASLKFVIQKSLEIIGPFPFVQLFLNFTKKWFIIVSINT